MFARLAAAIAGLTLSAHAALPPKATDYTGTVVTVSDKTIEVKGRVGSRLFQIHPGTIFGKGNRQKLADFKPGAYVTVVFSDSFGTWKAENIRSATPPAAGTPAAQQAKGMPAIKPMPKPVSSVGTTHSKK